MPFEANRKVETSTRTFSMIERLSTEGRLGVSALAAELDVSKGIVHNHPSTLRELGYVRKIGEEYNLGRIKFGIDSTRRRRVCSHDSAELGETLLNVLAN